MIHHATPRFSTENGIDSEKINKHTIASMRPLRELARKRKSKN